MADSLRVVVIGGVAAGPKTAAKIKRLRPDARVTLVEKGRLLSYAGCGLPYYIAGHVKEHTELMATAIGVVRDSAFFKTVKGVDVLTRTEATAIDRRRKRVEVTNLDTGEAASLEYDKLVLATGARAVVPPIPGRDLENVFVVHRVEDAIAIREQVDAGKVKRAVIVGGGLIGLETAEALRGRGIDVTMIEMLPQIAPILDWEMAKAVEKHLRAKGVDVHTHSPVVAIEPVELGGGRVGSVRTEQQSFPADIVIMSIGVRPNADLAAGADLRLGKTGAIAVDDHLRTSDPDIYAVGDCVEAINVLTGRPAFVPLGSTANKQGRLAALNVCGGDETFPGVLCSTVCKVFDFTIARTGLGESQAREAGFEPIACLAPGADRAHYYPGSQSLLLKLIVDRRSRRVIGAQATGPGEAAKRVDVAATAIAAGLTVDQVAKLDLCYAPPYSPAMDNLIVAADVIRNKLDEAMNGIAATEVRRMIDAGEQPFLLDVRSPGEYQEMRIPGATLIPLGAIRERTHEVPRDKPVVAYCKSSLRAYEASRILHGEGFENVHVMDGGILMWPYEVEIG